MTSAEYSGPLEFTQFWLDTIVEWERETGRDVLVGLSAPKDVQDAILADPERAPHVDVIDIRYWAYTADDGLYAPKGGQNLAPRQHLRQTRLKPGGAAAIVKAVREYRDRYPDKAVLYNAEENCPSIARRLGHAHRRRLACRREAAGGTRRSPSDDCSPVDGIVKWRRIRGASPTRTTSELLIYFDRLDRNHRALTCARRTTCRSLIDVRHGIDRPDRRSMPTDRVKLPAIDRFQLS